MQRCLQLASPGLGLTYPNPLVGSVIVHDNKIIGEGWHKKAGEPHAEIVAINSVLHPELLKESTLYVNLEPCSHFGKTPPCAHKIVALEIPRVVVGCRDLASHVNGQGIAYMRDHGVEVIEKILEQEARWLNRRFFTFQIKKRPYIILKYAQTTNGYFAPKNDNQKWITSTYSKQIVHKWRTEEQAILVGKRTAKIDHPQLNARLWDGPQPTRLLISKVIDETTIEFGKSDNPTIIFNQEQNGHDGNTSFVKIDFTKNTLSQLLTELHKINTQSVIIEGGVTTLNHFIQQNLWDEARVLVGAESWSEGMRAPELANAHLIKTYKIDQDTHYIYQNKKI